MSDERRPSPLSERLRQFVTDSRFEHNARLPPERELCVTLNVTRGELRKALSDLVDRI